MYIKGMRNGNEHIGKGMAVRLNVAISLVLFLVGTTLSLFCENYWIVAFSYVLFYGYLAYIFFSMDERLFSNLSDSNGQNRSLLTCFAVLLFSCVIVSAVLGFCCFSIALLVNSAVLFFVLVIILSFVFWLSSKEESGSSVTCVCPDDL